MMDGFARFLLRGLLTLLSAVLLTAGDAALAEGRKLALVVGNEAYQNAPTLTTPGADAQAMSKALRDLGFEVTVLTDVGPEVFDAVLSTFSEQAKEAETVLFYYSGHAFQMGGVNRLVPVTAKLDDPAKLEAQTWALDDIAKRLRGGSSQLLIFLDACRTNPLPEGVQASGQSGLAQYDGGTGTFVAFATAPGQVAWDKTEGSANSPFTGALLSRIAKPGQSISDLMIAVRNDVDQATGGKQTPWEQSSLRSQFFFLPPNVPAETEALPDFDIVDAATEIMPPALPEGTAVIQSVDGKNTLRLAALSSDTRSLPVIGGVEAGSAPRVKGVESGGSDETMAAVQVPQAVDVPQNVPEGIQRELQRIGCYAMKVDGDWGNGSRNAMKAYYKAKKVEVGELEPTADVYIALAKEPEKTCDEPAEVPVAVKKPAPKAPAAKAPATKKASTTTSKPAETKKPAAAATAPAGKGPKCKFMVVAIVCS